MSTATSRYWQRLLTTVGLSACLATPALAQDSEECVIAGVGDPCGSDADCIAGSAPATACVFDTGLGRNACQIPCERREEVVLPNGTRSTALYAEPGDCAAGEVCSEAVRAAGGQGFVCESVPFSMDLNLLDTCVLHWIQNKTPPGVKSTEACSSVGRLQRVLDRDRNRDFNILDVDLCVQDFLETPACEAGDDDCVHCASDADCGRSASQPSPGLFCDPVLHRCSRECGRVVERAQKSKVESFERTCGGLSEICDYGRGECREIDMAALSCQLDQDCPGGGYCSLGQCAPLCYRSTDCPGADWYCGRDNRCAPTPLGGSGAGTFDPKRYGIQFASDQTSLDPIDDERSVPLAIMDRETRRPVFDDKSVLFGYRLEVTYQGKQDAKCSRLSELSEADFLDCTIQQGGTDSEAFVAIENPFGTVVAQGQPAIRIKLDQRALGLLSAGRYSATLTAMFSNGSSASTVVTVVKPSLSGEYMGRVSVYLDGSTENMVASMPMGMRLYVDQGSTKQWDTLLKEKGFLTDNWIQDVTTGYVVTGKLSARSNTMFANPKASGIEDDEIPIVGLYSPQLRRMRLISLIDIPAGLATCDRDNCASPSALKLTNPFGRDIRRAIEFIGPYDTATRRFEGIYRETLSGLVPERDDEDAQSDDEDAGPKSVTLNGGFQLIQRAEDPAPIDYAETKFERLAQDIAFPGIAPRPETTAACRLLSPSQLNEIQAAAKDAEKLNTYLVKGSSGPVFADLMGFGSQIERALGQLSNRKSEIALADFLRGQVRLWRPTDGVSPAAVSIDRNKLECALAYFQNALVRAWVPLEPCAVDADGNASCVGTALFTCEQHALGSPECSGGDPSTTVRAIQEHNRFYRMLMEGLTFEAMGQVSDAAYTLYKASQGGSSFAEGSAYNYKEARLRDALKAYDEALAASLSPAGTASLWDLPMRRFAGQGSELVKQLHTITNDRMTVLLDLLDLRRRVTENAGSKQLDFAHQAVQVEYLTQVYLALLERRWKGAGFAYKGQGPAMLERGTILLAKADDTRNPLGLHPDRVYFFEGLEPGQNGEELVQNNWIQFRNRLRNDHILPLNQTVSTVIQSMKEAWRQRSEIESEFRVSSQRLDEVIEQICGADEEQPTGCYPDEASKDKAAKCYGASCDFQFTCSEGDARCESLKSEFVTAQGSDEACRADARLHYVNNDTRLCVRGQVGSLMREQMALELRREQVQRRVQKLIDDLTRETEYLEFVAGQNNEFKAYLEKRRDQTLAIEISLRAAQVAYDTTVTAASGAKCLVIAGTANGTDCAGTATYAGVTIAAIATKGTIDNALQQALSGMEKNKEIEGYRVNFRKEQKELENRLDSLSSQIGDLVMEYESIQQQVASLSVRIADQLNVAERTYERYTENLTSVVDSLLGRESGGMVVANDKVMEFEAKYQEALMAAYKMVQAFVHRYNYAEVGSNTKETLINRAFKAVTIADLENLIVEVENLAKFYCGSRGIDCGAMAETNILKVSLQKLLYPGMRDIVDPATGNVLSVGEQFSKALKSAHLVKRLERNQAVDTRIEVPFGIFLEPSTRTGRDNTSWAPAISDQECNHILTAGPGANQQNLGVMAVVLKGSGLRPSGQTALQVRVERGDTEYIRSCRYLIKKGRSAINTYLVGSILQDTTQSAERFTTRSAEFTPCFNAASPGTECYHSFALNRSLSAPDWTVVIPDLDTEEGRRSWLLDDGAVIEDIELHLRYSARSLDPITQVVPRSNVR